MGPSTKLFKLAQSILVFSLCLCVQQQTHRAFFKEKKKMYLPKIKIFNQHRFIYFTRNDFVLSDDTIQNVLNILPHMIKKCYTF